MDINKPVALPARKKWVTPLGSATIDIEADGWIACLDEIAKLGPLYPCADPGEVDRLQAALRTEVEAGDSWKREAETLRAQLAEAHTLLSEVMEPACKLQPISHSLIDKIDAALSASAEPKPGE